MWKIVRLVARVQRTQTAALQQDSLSLFPSKLQKDEFHLESS